MATQQPAAPAAAASSSKKTERLNVLKFNLAGHIPVNSKDVKTIVAASELFGVAVSILKGTAKIEEVKAALEAAAKNKIAATITKDEEPQFTTVSASGDED